MNINSVFEIILLVTDSGKSKAIRKKSDGFLI